MSFVLSTLAEIDSVRVCVSERASVRVRVRVIAYVKCSSCVRDEV